MSRKYLIPAIFIGVGLAFVFVSFMVKIRKGKSPKWLARKMKLGGILLTITTFTSCGSSGQSGGEIMCYDVAVSDDIYFDEASGGFTIKMNPDTGNVLNGNINNKHSNFFSYSISDSNNKVLFVNSINVIDKDTISYADKFKIKVDQNLAKGKYVLKIYTLKPENQDSNGFRSQFDLIIEKKER